MSVSVCECVQHTMQCVGYPAGTGHALKHKQQDEFVKQHERGAASPSFSSPPSILFFWCLSLSHSSHCMACEKWKMKNSFALSSDIINFSLFCTDQANAAEASAAAEKEGTKKTETRSTLIGDTGRQEERRQKRAKRKEERAKKWKFQTLLQVEWAPLFTIVGQLDQSVASVGMGEEETAQSWHWMNTVWAEH